VLSKAIYPFSSAHQVSLWLPSRTPMSKQVL